ncbi:MAG: ATP-binding protein [Lachnospiraceae bacterium]|nr:ATP-binding protein [Lachnospiraceae bacterium]
MALTNRQFDELIHEYELKRLARTRLIADRTKEVYAKVDGYKELEDTLASLGPSYTRRMLDGDSSAMEELHAQIADIKDMKQHLLEGAGYPADYLDPPYECPDCQDTGFIGNEKCHCLRHKMISMLYAQSNIQMLLDEQNFENLSYSYYKGADLDRFKKAVENSRQFIARFDEEYQNLLFYGNVGVGKSFLSGCIAKELLEAGKSVIYFSSSELFNQLAKNTFDTKSKENLYSFLEDLYNCDLVIVDDLGTELVNSFVTTQFFSFLTERHLRKKSTIISTNLSLSEIRDRYTDRVFSRISSSFQLMLLSGADIRIMKKAEM